MIDEPFSVTNLAQSLGFDVCRTTRVDEAWSAGDGLKAFVAAGSHGEMTWMEDTLDRRSHPNAMWPEAKSAVVVGMNYGCLLYTSPSPRDA